MMRTTAWIVSFVIALASLAGATTIPVDVHASCADSIALDAATRSAHVGSVRSVLVDALHDAPTRGKLFGVDASIVRLDATESHGYVDVRAEVHVVLSDRDGIQWFGTSEAKIHAPAHAIPPERLRQLQREAVENATEDLVRPVRAHLEAAARRTRPLS